MNKRELYDTVYKMANDRTESFTASKENVKIVVDEVFRAIASALYVGEKVKVQGFGNFEMKETSSRTGRSFATGGTVSIPAGRKPVFVVAKSLKDALNAPEENFSGMLDE